MLRTNTGLLVLFLLLFSINTCAFGQNSNPTRNLQELPFELSWDDYGVIIRSKGADQTSINLLDIIPSQYMEKLSNDFVRIKVGGSKTPVIVDLSSYYQSMNQAGNFNIIESPAPKIKVEMPRLSLADNSDPGIFTLELSNFTKIGRFSKQTILFKGLDVLHVTADDCAKLAATQRTINIDVHKCDVNFIILRGGLLKLNDMKKIIPELCRKYNNRYYIKEDAFVCLEDCSGEDPKSAENLQHVRTLITKYNITDFEDEPISFIDNIILTKKGIGINLKTKDNNRINEKKVPYSVYDEFRFFPWFEFINLNFQKYVDSKQVLLNDPYNNNYIFTSRSTFSNVELIQFLNELKALITRNVY